MNIEVSLQFMGPAKQFHPDGKIKLQLEQNATIQNLRKKLTDWMHTHNMSEQMFQILNASVFADTQKIFREEDTLRHQGAYVLIPPISGG